MGKSSKPSKGKEKKLQREADRIAREKVIETIKTVNQISDPLVDFPVFQTYNRNGLDMTISCKQAENMSEEEKTAVFNHVKDNMQKLYEQSDWSWKPKEKWDEMTHHNARYLLVREKDKEEIVAMVHFRFDIGDDDVEVLYCYEIQLSPQMQGKGLGRFLMQICALIGAKNGMKKVVLTVFKANLDAINFFKKLGYEVDGTCPTLSDGNLEEDYFIYSKSLVKKEKAAPLERKPLGTVQHV